MLSGGMRWGLQAWRQEAGCSDLGEKVLTHLIWRVKEEGYSIRTTSSMLWSSLGVILM